ncbi:hypothetical protein ACWGI9_41510 [Streptomyces sp. NPDC054833]
MAKVVAAGKARWIGLFEVTVEQVERARRVHPVAGLQSELSPGRQAAGELAPQHEPATAALVDLSE